MQIARVKGMRGSQSQVNMRLARWAGRVLTTRAKLKTKPTARVSHPVA